LLRAILLSITVYICIDLQEAHKFYWGYAIIIGAIILVWLLKEVIDFFRVTADNKRVDRGGHEVISRVCGAFDTALFASLALGEHDFRKWQTFGTATIHAHPCTSFDTRDGKSAKESRQLVVFIQPMAC
jgi:hypothetical protein